MSRRRHLERSTDEQLVAAMLGGDGMALEVLYDRHVDRVLALACRMVGMRRPAEEVVRVAFEIAWARPAAYRPERGSVRGWLLAITHERALAVLRGSASAGRPLREPAARPYRAGPRDVLAARRATRQEDAADLLVAAFAGLAPEQSRVVELAYFGGYDHTEIAAMLDVPADTVKRRMRAALEHLDAVHPQSAS